MVVSTLPRVQKKTKIVIVHFDNRVYDAYLRNTQCVVMFIRETVKYKESNPLKIFFFQWSGVGLDY